MSIDHGAYMGGVRSIKDIRDRCSVDDDTGCWHWKLAINAGAPHVHFAHDGKRYVMRGRRAVTVLLTGKLVPKSMFCIGRDSCDADCVAPEHIKAVNRMAVGAQIRRTGKGKTVAKKAGGRKSAAANRKLTVDQVAAIRSSTAPIRALAVEFGVSKYAIWAARTGKSFRDGVANNSVFNWRPAA